MTGSEGGAWRPIETAPRDAQVLIAMPSVPRSVAEAYCDSNGYLWVQGHQPSGKPTHWMPLPAPPAEEVGG